MLIHTLSSGLQVGPESDVDNLPNGIAAHTPACVTNLAITTSGTMLLNGLESTNAQPAYFHNRSRVKNSAYRPKFIPAVTRPGELGCS